MAQTELTSALSAWAIAAREADEAGVERPIIPDDLARALLDTAQSVARRHFRRSPHRDDLASCAVLHALRVLVQCPASDRARAWLVTVMRRRMADYFREVGAQQFRDLVYAREVHRNDATVAALLAEPSTQATLAHHEARMADSRRRGAEARAAKGIQPRTRKPKKPVVRQQQRRNVTLPDGEVITAYQLATRLGTTHTTVYRRLRAGRSVEQILDEFGPVKSGDS